ncbi:MAG: efflux transporter outer membrane subunit [Akkermansia sp.]|nr:efflux transporter outer membrane subunit [Akkermansia sp.]
MKHSVILTLAGTALLLSSCALGPRWQEPNMPVPAEFRGAGISGSTMADLPWQEVLHDSQLQALLHDVFANNRNLQAMEHNVNAARHYVTVEAAPLFPWVRYGGSASKGMNNAGGSTITQTGGRTAAPGSAALSASWELDIWGATRKKVESATAQAQAAEENFNNMRISLMRTVANGYLQLLMLDEQLRIAKESVGSYQESLDLFNNRLKGGIGTSIQTAAAEAALAAAQAQVPQLEAQITAMENTLSVLAGRMPGHISRSGSLDEYADASYVDAGIPAQVISRRPDIRAKELELRAANADVGVAITQYFPSISLTGALGYASADLRTAIKTHRTGWGIGANLTGPIFQAGMLRANHKMKKDAFLAAKANYEQAVLDAMSEISTTLVQRQKLHEQMLAQEKAVAAYQENVRLAKELFTQGYSSYYEVLDAQRGLFPAQISLAALRYQYAACIPTLYTQLGGGWRHVPAPQEQAQAQ